MIRLNNKSATILSENDNILIDKDVKMMEYKEKEKFIVLYPKTKRKILYI